MKLIKCHIENFGKLNNFDFNFSAGYNNIKEENGWGKSTFATFIKAMFYGLPNSQGNDLNKKEREKYYPWQGGNFGGNLEFELNNKKYKIERFFGKKKSEDSFNLVDLSTGKKTSDFSANLGEEIFDLDEDAFERSSYIPQKALNADGKVSITNKLTNLIQGTAEEFDFKAIQNRLNENKKILYNKNKSGEIQQLESKKEDLILQINELKTTALSINDFEQKIEQQDQIITKLVEEQNQIKSQIKDYYKIQEKKANQEYFNKLNGNISLTKKSIQEKVEKLNHQNLTTSQIDDYIVLYNRMHQNQNKLEAKKQSNYVIQKHDELQNYFDGKDIPTSDKIKEITDDIYRFNELKQFKANNITNKQKTYSAQSSQKRNSIICAILSIICFLSGFVCLKSLMFFAIGLFVIGTCSLLIAGFLYLVNMINVKTSERSVDNSEQIKINDSQILILENKIKTFFIKYNCDENNFLDVINNLNLKIKEYQNIKQQYQTLCEENDVILNEIESDNNLINNFLLKFNLNENLSSYDKLVLLRQIIQEISKEQEELKKQEAELVLFKKEKNFDIDESSFVDITINDLQDNERLKQKEIDECRDLRTTYISKINKLQDDLAGLNDLENEKEQYETQIFTLNKKLNAIKNAEKFLKEANDSLSSKFREPMRNAIVKYINLITNKNFDNLQIDTKFNITLEEFGQEREVEYYSKGYKNTIDLCMRFALIDCLFVKEKPFIILDDPFVNMDDTKIKNAKQFLVELSKQYQIIYFSCHDSRC